MMGSNYRDTNSVAFSRKEGSLISGRASNFHRGNGLGQILRILDSGSFKVLLEDSENSAPTFFDHFKVVASEDLTDP
jgi:hypothetical protein